MRQGITIDNKIMQEGITMDDYAKDGGEELFTKILRSIYESLTIL